MASDHHIDDEEWPEDTPDKGSDNEVSLPPAINPTSPSRKFKVSRAIMSRHYDIKQASEPHQHLYYVGVSNFSAGTPDVTFHAGADDKAPVVGVCHLAKFASKFEVGIGDPKENPASVQWSTMTRKNFLSATYLWTLILQGGEKQQPQQRNLAWVREGFRDLRLQDANSGEVLATYRRKGGFMNSEVEIHSHNLGAEFDMLVMLTSLSIHIKTKRRKAGGFASAAGASG